MRRLIALCITMLASLPLLGAAPFFPTPVVTVYAFTLNGSGVEKDSGSKLAVIVANQMALLGGLNVLPGPVATERKDYLSVARSNGADYYVAGYVTPIGNDVSVVEQVVSTTTGVVVFSNTAQLRTYDDAAGQGELLRAAILRHSQRNLEAYAAAPPPPAATPAPKPSEGAQANISGLFRRKKQATRAAASPAPRASSSPNIAVTPRAVAALPAPTPVPTPTKPVPTPRPTVRPATYENQNVYGVLQSIGTASDDLRAEATRAIVAALDARGRMAKPIDSTTFRDASKTCAAAGYASAIFGSTLALSSSTARGATATLGLTVYDCRGRIVYQHSTAADGRDPKLAIRHAVDAAIAAYLNPSGARR